MIVPFVQRSVTRSLLRIKVNTKVMCEICSKLTITTPERRHWRNSGVFIASFEHISHIVLGASIVNF